MRVIGKINYTHRGGGDGGATASEIPPQSAAYLKSSRRRKLDSLSPLFLPPSFTLCTALPTSGVCVRVRACVYPCVHARARARVYISTSRADAAKPRAGVATAPKSSTDSLMVISHLCNLRHPSSRAFSISDRPTPLLSHPAPPISCLPPAPVPRLSSLLSSARAAALAGCAPAGGGRISDHLFREAVFDEAP